MSKDKKESAGQEYIYIRIPSQQVLMAELWFYLYQTKFICELAPKIEFRNI